MVRIKWHLHTKQVENRVDLYHDNNREDEIHLKVNKHNKQLWLELKETYFLNK